LSTTSQTRHAVTAIIVAHDGATLLPGLVQALAAQTYPVEQTVGVDTGSRDRSGAVLADLIGQDAVFGMNRSTGYGDAVAVGLRHAIRRRSGMTDPNIGRVEWIWLLHDDCEPAPDALEKLLLAAGKDPAVVVVGPKVLDGKDRRTICEAGVSIDRAGRRVTGIDPGEIDQGQHDHKRAVLAVGSAGMLVRREVWDRLGGFDPRLKFFRDDVDFCWRVQAAGLRVHVATDAVLYHHELAGRRRRPIDGGSARWLDRRNALYVLAVNLPLPVMLWVVGGCVVGSLIRATYFLLTKQLDLAGAYAFSVAGLFAHPVRLFKGRRRRARGHAEGYAAVRLFIPPARTFSRLAEKISGLLSNGPPQASFGRHVATVEESEEDAQFEDTQSTARRIIGHPGVQLFAVLLLISLIAERRLLGTSPLGGGALVPAWGGSAALWQEYLAGFHAVSVGSTASAPPYLAVVAALATVLGGQGWLAVDVLLLGCVPLAGLTAFLATRWLVTATPARVLLAASYALLPVATGSIAAGRLGTATAFVLLPLIAVSAGRMLTAAPRKARRAAWAAGLLIAVAAAFAPLIWVLGVLFAAGALAARRWLVAVDPLNIAVVIVTPFFVLFPWSLHLLASPSAFLSEAGLSQPGLTTAGLSPAALLALSPGGPGVPPLWVTLGFGLALVAAVLPGKRAPLVIAGWTVAIAGLLTATVVSRISVTPPAGGQPADGWPGVGIALAALGLLVASAPTAEWLALIIPNGVSRLPGAALAGSARSRRILACAALAAAATAPLLVAAYWVKDGVRGPVGSVAAPVLPAFVAASSTADQQYRTLILRPDSGGLAAGGLDYTVVRQSDPSLGQPELGVNAAAEEALSRQVAALGAPDGADAGDPGLVLGEFGIRWVLLPGPVNSVLAQRLDAAIGLVALSKAPNYDLWQVAGTVARVRVVAPDGATTAVASGAVTASGVAAPASGGTLELAEPYGGWTATLNGRALKPLPAPVDGWAQGFVLPPGGGQLSITRNDLARTLSLILELIATLAVCLLALPGKRADPVEEAEALAALREARSSRRAVGSARRAARPAGASGAGHRAVSAGRRAVGAGRRTVDAGRTVVTSRRPGDAGWLGKDAGDRKSAGHRGAGAGHRAAGGTDRFGFGRKRPADRVAAAGAGQDPELTGPAEAGSGDAMPASPAGWGQPSHDLDQDDGPGDRGPGTLETGGSGAGAWSFPGEAAREAFPGATPHSSAGAPGNEAGPPGRPDVAPWDLPGDSGSAGPARGRQARAANPLADDGSQEAPDWLTGQQPAARQVPAAETPAQDIRASSGTGPRRPPWESGPDFPVSSSGDRPRLPWESGPEFPVSSTGARPDHPWESAPEAPASPAGAQPEVPAGPQRAPLTAPQRQAATGAQPVTPTGPQPSFTPTGPQPSFTPTGPQPSFTPAGPRHTDPGGPQPFTAAGSQPFAPTDSESVTPAGSGSATPSGPQPLASAGFQPFGPADSESVAPAGSGSATPSGPQPFAASGFQPFAPADSESVAPSGDRSVGLPPWESGEWGQFPEWNPGEDNTDAGPAETGRGTGSGSWPAAARSAWREPARPQPPGSEPGKPERHSHRAGRHGRPSRWRGSRDRSGGNGES